VPRSGAELKLRRVSPRGWRRRNPHPMQWQQKHSLPEAYGTAIVPVLPQVESAFDDDQTLRVQIVVHAERADRPILVA